MMQMTESTFETNPPENDRDKLIKITNELISGLVEKNAESSDKCNTLKEILDSLEKTETFTEKEKETLVNGLRVACAIRRHPWFDWLLEKLSFDRDTESSRKLEALLGKHCLTLASELKELRGNRLKLRTASQSSSYPFYGDLNSKDPGMEMSDIAAEPD